MQCCGWGAILLHFWGDRLRLQRSFFFWFFLYFRSHIYICEYKCDARYVKEFVCEGRGEIWAVGEECERRRTGKRGQIEERAGVNRVNKHRREVLSPCTGRGLASVCVYVWLYQTQLASICTGMSLPLKGPSLLCFEGPCMVEVSACVCSVIASLDHCMTLLNI